MAQPVRGSRQSTAGIPTREFLLVFRLPPPRLTFDLTMRPALGDLSWDWYSFTLSRALRAVHPWPFNTIADSSKGTNA